MRDDDRISSDDLIREAREELSSPGFDEAVTDEVEIPEPDIDAIVAAELDDPPPAPAAAEPSWTAPKPRVGPADPEMAPSSARPARPPEDVDERRGVLLAIGAAAAGAFAWAALLAYAEIQLWLLGIAIGWLIGTAAMRGAGHLTSRLKVIVAALAIGAVAFGEVLGVAMLWNKEFGFFDLPLAARFYVENLDQLGGEVLFALGGGALGAWTAIRQGTKQQ